MFSNNIIKINTLLAIFALGYAQTTHALDSCDRWFLSSPIFPGHPSCTKDCKALPSDTNTFKCQEKCEVLCAGEIKNDNVERYIDARAINPKERILFNKYPTESIIILQTKLDAEKSTGRIFGFVGVNDESAAFRQFTWAALAAKAIGREIAELFLMAHRDSPTASRESREMSEFNSTQGLETYSKVPSTNFGEEIEKIALKKIKSNELKIIKTNGDVPAWRR